MLDFYQNLNINSGMLSDIESEKNSLSNCGSAGKVKGETLSNIWELTFETQHDHFVAVFTKCMILNASADGKEFN
jgi:hypothetical protein